MCTYHIVFVLELEVKYIVVSESFVNYIHEVGQAGDREGGSLITAG